MPAVELLTVLASPLSLVPLTPEHRDEEETLQPGYTVYGLEFQHPHPLILARA